MPISIMLKPSSSACNLRCDYCFYADVAEHRSVDNKGMMTEETAERVIESALDYCNDRIFFTFQGGEPLLRGIEFFYRFTATAKKLNTNGTKIHYALQTNGTLLNDEWCRLFRDNGFLVGVSLDGDEELNDYRRFADGTPSYPAVMQGIELLKKHNVPFNILSVLTKRTANNFRRSYRFFKANGLEHLQYIPCLKPFGEADNEYSMSVDDYSDYLQSSFRVYYNDILRGKTVSIRQLDNYCLLAQGGNAEQCGMNGTCSNQFVVEGDGSVYPCDFYCTDRWYLGNINDGDFSLMGSSSTATEFIKESFVMPDQCKDCKHLFLCRAGGCKRNRESYNYCKAYKQFFDANTDNLKKLAR